MIKNYQPKIVQKNIVATVPTVHGIETNKFYFITINNVLAHFIVATVPTVHGIETSSILVTLHYAVVLGCNSTYRSRY